MSDSACDRPTTYFARILHEILTFVIPNQLGKHMLPMFCKVVQIVVVWHKIEQPNSLGAKVVAACCANVEPMHKLGQLSAFGWFHPIACHSVNQDINVVRVLEHSHHGSQERFLVRVLVFKVLQNIRDWFDQNLCLLGNGAPLSIVSFNVPSCLLLSTSGCSCKHASRVSTQG